MRVVPGATSTDQTEPGQGGVMIRRRRGKIYIAARIRTRQRGLDQTEPGQGGVMIRRRRGN